MLNGLIVKDLIESETKRFGGSRRKGLHSVSMKLREQFTTGAIKLEEVSLKELAVGLCGQQWYDKCDPAKVAQEGFNGVNILEAAEDAIDVTAFSNITGQIVYTAIHQGYANEAFLGSQLAAVEPTSLLKERIPGFQSISDEALRVHDGQPLPYVGFGEHFQDTPETVKYSLGVAMTKEMVFFDKLGTLLEHARRQVGFRLGIRKEKEIIDCVIGAINNYDFRGTGVATYQLGPLVPGLYINDLAGNELIDWNNIDAADQLLAKVTDPDSGDPILPARTQLLTTRAKRMTALRIASATEIRETNGGNETMSANPVSVDGIPMSSALVDQRLALLFPGKTDAQRAKYWLYGDFMAAFKYRQNWALTVMQAAANSEADFDRDIPFRWKATERGVCYTRDPRFVNRNFDT